MERGKEFRRACAAAGLAALLALAVPVSAQPSDAAVVAAGPAPAVAAMYRVIVERPGKPVVRQTWYFSRSDSEVGIVKGGVEEIWHRDPQGRIDFRRVFHADQRVVGYTAGELATLGVEAQWQTLGELVDRSQLRLSGDSGRSRRWTGRVGGHAVSVDWRTALGLPERVTTRYLDGSRTRLVLVQHRPAAPADWPRAGQRGEDYLHLDAADFGDMPYEPVVRKSTALDIRLGWRVVHDHN